MGILTGLPEGTSDMSEEVDRSDAAGASIVWYYDGGAKSQTSSDGWKSKIASQC